MNPFNKIAALLGLAASMPAGVEQTDRPGWAGARTKMRGGSRRKRETVLGTTQRKGYFDKNTRDVRFRDLRAAGRKHVTKYSSVNAGGQNIWYVSWSG